MRSGNCATVWPLARTHPNAVRERSGPARSGEALLRDTARLRFLEAIPPLDAADMCSECPTPAAWHSLTVTFNLDPSKDVGRVDGPCPAWPWWRERLEEARRQILALAFAQGRAASGCPKGDRRDRIWPAYRGSHRPAQCRAG